MKQIVIAGRTGKAAELRRLQDGTPVSQMRFAPLPSADVLRELISYDASAGSLTWKDRPRRYFSSDKECTRWNTRYSGRPCLASRTRGGYLSGAIFKRLYLAHRVCWTIHHGKAPALIIDHVNGDRSDNRISNLREANFRDNVGNRNSASGSASRYRGVAKTPDGKRWVAYCAGEVIGRFDDEDAAAAAVNSQLKSAYGEFAKLNAIGA